ncbi:unnamed protein product, partial [Porites evermanni]
NTGLSVARRSSLPSSGVPQRSSKSASSQLPSGKDNRDVKRRRSGIEFDNLPPKPAKNRAGSAKISGQAFKDGGRL